jgi:hypothetical protein
MSELPLSAFDPPALDLLGGHAIPLRLEYRLPPNSPLSDGDARRLAHEDLLGLDTAGLEVEAWRCRLTLAFGDFSGAPPWAREWLEERLEKCKRIIKKGR